MKHQPRKFTSGDCVIARLPDGSAWQVFRIEIPLRDRFYRVQRWLVDEERFSAPNADILETHIAGSIDEIAVRGIAKGLAAMAERRRQTIADIDREDRAAVARLVRGDR